MAKPNGRRSKLTKVRRDEAIDLLSRGIEVDTISAYIGVSPSTIRHWIREGQRAIDDRDERGIAIPSNRKVWAQFSVDVKRARSEFEIAACDDIANAGRDGDWKATAFRLKVFNRARYGDKATTELTGADGGPVKLEVGGTLADAIAAAKAAMPGFAMEDE